MVLDIVPEKMSKLKYYISRFRKAAWDTWQYPDDQKFLYNYYLAIADRKDVLDLAKRVHCDNFDVFFMMLKKDWEDEKLEQIFVLREWEFINENKVFD